MEGFNKPEEITSTEKETREEKIEAAAKSVSDVFNEKLAGVLGRIEESPYFRGLEESF